MNNILYFIFVVSFICFTFCFIFLTDRIGCILIEIRNWNLHLFQLENLRSEISKIKETEKLTAQRIFELQIGIKPEKENTNANTRSKHRRLS